MKQCRPEPGGIYIHIPFCKKKCPYCDFYSVSDLSLLPAFIKALMLEMEIIARNGCIPSCYDTIYIGGGTPSLLKADDVGKIIDSVYKSFHILSDPEITIEMNPGLATEKWFAEYKNAGVNRINIGVQSFEDKNLGFLGRIHSGQEANIAVKRAKKAGFESIGLDLIYSIPGQTKKSWLLDMQRAVEFEPEHVACYMLTYEPGTPMEKDLKKKRFIPVPERSVCDLYEHTVWFLADQGYAQYEISNFERVGLEKSLHNRSRHNQKYWSFIPYLGLGPSAHSFVEPLRYRNRSSVKQYLKDLKMGILPIKEKELLTSRQLTTEAIYLGFRQTDGIDICAFDKKFNTDFNSMFDGLITDLGKKGLIRSTRECCALTQKGMLFLDSIVSMFVCADIE